MNTICVESGFVVSPKHGKFVSHLLNINSEKIGVLPAGISTDKIKSRTSKREDETWRFVYHGRLDRHRGILEFMNSIQELNDLGLQCIFTLIGEGTAVEDIKRLCDTSPDSFIHKRSMNHDEIHEELRKHHVGVLPMPEKKVWKLASPLKRGEYLASGLMVVGLDHDGHRLQGVDEKWFHLNSKPTLTSSIYDLFNNLNDEEFDRMSIEAQNYAIRHLSWDVSVQTLVSQLRGDMNV